MEKTPLDKDKLNDTSTDTVLELAGIVFFFFSPSFFSPPNHSHHFVEEIEPIFQYEYANLKKKMHGYSSQNIQQPLLGKGNEQGWAC